MKSFIWYQLASAALLTRRCAALSQPSPSPRLQNVVDVPSFSGVGITSILPVPSTSDEYYVGTKRGKVKRIKMIPEQFGDAHQTVSIDDIEDANGRQLKPYPVFSMMSVPNGEGDNHDLLTGGGDRYATVWRRGERGWEAVEQLGPHTGWVKDLASASVDGKTFVFSIGCNCIEVWSADRGRYKHMHKLQIESSVESGSTLSSDLLCLATYSELGVIYLLAGGVDGRIHRWEIHSNTFRNAGVISAHDGRGTTVASNAGR
ncbi:hypothetical protein ACHAXT_002075 [Thalassiosira profunda]